MIVRAPAEADLAALPALVRAAGSDLTEADLREDRENADLARNAWVVELDGRLAGHALLLDHGGGRLGADGWVDASFEGRGIGSELLRLTEERARELAAGIEGRVVLVNVTRAGGPCVAALYARRGYTALLRVHRMLAELADEPPEPSRPLGAEIAPYDHPRDARDFHATLEDGFARDPHHHPETFEAFEARRLGGSRFDPSLWLVARAEGEIVGALAADGQRRGDWGWIGAVAVREPWRRRGIGEALLRASFREFHRRGERRVALGVDAENATGATRLYERLGMRVRWEAVVYEQVLRG